MLRFRAVFEHIPFSVLIFSPDGLLLSLNKAAARLWGATPEAIGLMVNRYNLLEDEQLVEMGIIESMKQALTGKTIEFPAMQYDSARLSTKFGLSDELRSFWSRSTMFPAITEDGEIREIVLMHEDITVQKEAEEALKESEERFRALSDATFEGIVIHDMGLTIEVNKAFLDMTGYDRSEMIGQYRQDMLTDESLKAFMEHVASGSQEPYEVEVVRKDGSKFPAELRGRSILYKGQPVRVVAARDITERKRAEEEIKALNEQLEMRVIQRTAELEASIKRQKQLEFIVNKSPAVAFLWRAKEGWPVAYVSENIQQFGYTAEDLTSGRVPYISIIYPEDIERVGEEVTRYTTEGRNEFNQEYRILTKQGEVRWIDDRTWVRRNATGQVTHYQGVILDITDRKQAEIERMDRTLQLEVVNKEMEAFSYSVSHDLRAPLRSIDGFSQALVEDYESLFDAQGKDYLRRVRSAAQRMGLLIDDMLRLSRVTRAEMQTEDVDLSLMVKEITEQLIESDLARQVEFVIQPGVIVSGDKSLLKILLENLIDNAWKFTSKQVSAKIEFGEIQEEQDRVLFVRDNGVGFDMAYAGKLFTPFQRLHAESDFPGSGIGLAIVQRVVHRHEGRIWAEGEINHGAVFYFTLWSRRGQKGKTS